jgi:DNA-binding transcriptional regulator YiaG
MDKDAVKKFRQSLGLTQEKFADEIGVSRAAVAKWEGGIYRPSRLAMIQIERLRLMSEFKRKGGGKQLGRKKK